MIHIEKTFEQYCICFDFRILLQSSPQARRSDTGYKRPSRSLRVVHRFMNNLLPSLVPSRPAIQRFLSFVLAAVFLTFVNGCQTPMGKATGVPPENSAPDTTIALREGDALKISFPTASRLDTSQQVRRDGKIVLPVLGEVNAVGLTPAQLEQEILKLYGDQLATKEVSVTLVTSSYPVFVNGAVLNPGKITAERPITALEAIMEAGGFKYETANLKKVRVIRHEGSDVKTFTLDFKGVLSGVPTPPFYVKPSDIIYVPEKFTLF